MMLYNNKFFLRGNSPVIKNKINTYSYIELNYLISVESDNLFTIKAKAHDIEYVISGYLDSIFAYLTFNKPDDKDLLKYYPGTIVKYDNLYYNYRCKK